ncbi:hypothetical protein CU098_009205 [Rhizopus stolonifer]|uniref:Uncharacterized protein n=1 Tax=Rhizopus stolonifer TaxID=4846 RepID=A0A367JWX4_RHIST|nr:hypothetical protein CU098_009205 [Rhizopus stolonifer]
MNSLISFALFSYSVGFILLSVDGLMPNPVINQNKFATDALIANTNVCTVYLLLVLISIFHPRPQYAKQGDLSSENSTRPTSPPKIAIEDLYSSKPVMFSMVSPPYPNASRDTENWLRQPPQQRNS